LAFSLSFKPYSAHCTECRNLVFDDARSSSLDTSQELVHDFAPVAIAHDEERMNNEAAQYELHGRPLRCVSRLPAWHPIFFAGPQRGLPRL
jgi:hypothetical protein